MSSELNILPVLNRIQHSINSHPNLNNNLLTIIKGAKILIDFDYCGILIINRENNNLSHICMIPENSLQLNHLHKGLIEWILEHFSL